ncbi:unnamed protein product [Adineta ricciae]|uniref:Solute-binding protein family 3/N-terminal domain-containing protein n=1 Tax=Adineta ricciae TaxID=249248 RepID=A0A814ZBH1_ADIRI|nr:unnamed protein product [Adineta ricciae]
MLVPCFNQPSFFPNVIMLLYKENSFRGNNMSAKKWKAVMRISIIDVATRSDVFAPHFMWIPSSDVLLNSFNTTTARQKLAGILTITPVVGSAVGAAYDVWKEYDVVSFLGSDNSLARLCSMNGSDSSSVSFSSDSSFFDRCLDLLQFSSHTTDRVDGNYYIVKNIYQSSDSLNYTPVLVWSDSSDWNQNARTSVIRWPNTTPTVPKDYASVFGLIVRIAMIDSVPFTLLTEATSASGGTTTKLVGYIPDLVAQLQNRMEFVANFTFFSSDQSYNKLLDDVTNGTFDMLIGDVTSTSARRGKVGFSSVIFDSSLHLIPFSLKLWLVLLVATIYAGFLTTILEKQRKEALQGRSLISLIAMNMWFAFSAIVGFDADFHVSTAAGRLFTVGLYILGLALKSAGAISGIDDIKNGKVACSRIGIAAESSIEDYYLREISGGARNFYPLKQISDIYSGRLNNVIDAAISIYCNSPLVGADFDRSALEIVFPKIWLCEEDLDVAILSIREADLLDTLKLK